MTLAITIAIPTYNGGDRLPPLLERLKTQEGVEELAWEVLIIDNNSQDNTAAVVRDCQAQWPTAIPLRYDFEPRQGAAFARQRAIREANGELVGFLDDDNWPEPNWVAEAVQFAHSHPEAGAFGGRIYGAYQSPPPEGFEKIRAYLAIRDYGPTPRPYNPTQLQLPPAAALVIRRQAWLACVPETPALSGKVPGLFIQGDDYEPLLYLHKAGWQILYSPTLVTHHQIPAQRLERPYLLTLAQGCGLATCQLALIAAVPRRKPWVALRVFLGSTRRLLRHVLHHRGPGRSLAAAVEFHFHLGSVLSPFYVRRW